MLHPPSAAALRQACCNRPTALPATPASSCQPLAAPLGSSQTPGAARLGRAAHGDSASTAVCCLRTERGSRQRRAERQPSTQSEPDPQATYACFDSVSDSAAIHVFGLNHLEVEHAAAEFIWRTKPAVVAVETGFTAEHGARTGAVLSMGDHMQRAADFRLRTLSQIAAQLDASQRPEDSDIWQDLKGHLPGEQLVYVAAFAVGADLVYADRPKAVTFQRLHNIPSLADLDAAFARLSTDNYRELLAKHQGVSYTPPAPVNDCVYDILTAERDAVMAHALRSAADVEGATASVVGVVGQSHMQGIVRALQQRRQLDRATVAALNEPGRSPLEDASAAGTRRALLRAALGLCCSAEVLAEFDSTFGQLPEDQQEPYEVTTEIYGSTRMLLACLPPAELDAVCCGWNCDLREVLRPLAALRPVNGGSGCDMELALDLQMLYLEIRGGGGSGGGSAAVATEQLQ